MREAKKKLNLRFSKGPGAYQPDHVCFGALADIREAQWCINRESHPDKSLSCGAVLQIENSGRIHSSALAASLMELQWNFVDSLAPIQARSESRITMGSRLFLLLSQCHAPTSHPMKNDLGSAR
jgi:hypothetical protein